MLRRIYSLIWPLAFLTCGIISLAADGHVHFMVFGKAVNLHTLMWFMMAAAHADGIWGGRQRRNNSRG